MTSDDLKWLSKESKFFHERWPTPKEGIFIDRLNPGQVNFLKD